MKQAGHGLESFLALRAGPGRAASSEDLPAELSAALDQALADLYRAAGEPALTVVAVGGYGRAELCLGSDVDLLLLHDGDPGPVDRILYPLWDAHLKVGQAVRTVGETLSACSDQVATLCTVLTARTVVGDPGRLGRLEHELARYLRREGGRLRVVLAEEERAGREREPFQWQAPDLKSSRGGLRTLQRMEWDRRRARLVGETPPPPTRAEVEGRRLLLAVRNALHAVRGRPDDLLAVELRPAVAAWMDRDPHRLATEVLGALRAIDAAADRWWAGVRSPATDPVAAAGRRVMGAIRGRWEKVSGERPSPALAAAGRVLARGGPEWEGPVGPGLTPRWNSADRAQFLRLLAAGRRGWDAYLRLDTVDWVAHTVPELAHLRAAPQAEPFHTHPVDAHLWRTVDEVIGIAHPDGGEPWCAELAEQAGSLDEVLMAALFHDAGKGLGRDHSQAGAELATGFLHRAGFGTATAELVGKAVLHHLLLPRVATRRDLDDPAVIAEVAELVGDLHTLRVLTLLSVADARATGPGSWNSWRSSLLQKLTSRLTEAMSGSPRREGAEPLHRAARSRLLELVEGEVPVEETWAHLDSMPAGYLLRFGPEAVARHLRLASHPVDDRQVLFDVTHAAPISTLVMVARDRPGLLAALAGVLALHNVSVLEGRFATRADGLAIDTLRVEDALGSGMVGQGRWPAIRRDLEAVLAGNFPLRERLAAKAATYQRTGGDEEMVVAIRREGARRVLEVRAADRMGLLSDLASALAGLTLDVQLAKVDTRQDRVLDVFYLGESDVADETIIDAVTGAVAWRAGKDHP